MPDSPAGRALSRRGFLQMLMGEPGSVAAAVHETACITYDTPVLTPTARFYHQFSLLNHPPTLNRHDWVCPVDGLIQTPLTLTYAELRARPAMGDVRTLVSMGNPAGGEQIGTAVWRGCSLRAVLEEAGIFPEAAVVRFESADGYCTDVPLAHIRQHDALLAYEMNGALLPPEHGFPLRALVPGLYGSKSPKWLTRISLVAAFRPGTWEGEPHGWSQAAVVKTLSQIRTPAPYAHVVAGQPVALQGIAFAGLRRVTRVEVSIDGGDWVPVTLRPPDSPYAWTQWYAVWTPEMTGPAEIAVRATDDAGFTQWRRAGVESDAHPDGTDALHSVTVYVDGMP